MRDHGAMASSIELAVTAPFDGVVVAIPGISEQRVGVGSPLIVLEAMKMEHRIEAPVAGNVKDVRVKPGDLVKSGATLLTIGPA
jgi:biotin carboxyl carrier protein